MSEGETGEKEDIVNQGGRRQGTAFERTKQIKDAA